MNIYPPGRPVPAAILEIREAAAAANHFPPSSEPFARHTVMFRWGTPAETDPLPPGADPLDQWDGLDLAEFLSDAAMHIPREGDHLRLYGVPVRVVGVVVDYDVQEDGTHTVFAAVEITALRLPRR